MSEHYDQHGNLLKDYHSCGCQPIGRSAGAARNDAERLRLLFDSGVMAAHHDQYRTDLDAALAHERRDAALELLDELDVGFANNPNHKYAVIDKARARLAKR